MKRPGSPGRLLPGLTVLRDYERPWLRGDVLAGLAVTAYLVPQVIAYAGLAGLPPVAGLWAILAPLALYALFGSSRNLSVGPESTTALMTAAVVAPLAGGDPVRHAALAAGLAVMVGLLCLAAFVTRLGFVADLLSKPILIGYRKGDSTRARG
jgi:SulP family sulfate permease